MGEEAGKEEKTMIRVAVCDDEQEVGEQIASQTRIYYEKGNIAAAVRTFWKGKALLYELEEGAVFDLFLLDVELGDMDGIELARKLPALLPDAIVIFISLHTRYVLKGYTVKAFRYIPKNMMDQMLPIALRDAAGELNAREKRCYIAENQTGLWRLPLTQILYVWHEGKYSVLRMDTGKEVRVRKSLKQVYEEINSPAFVWVDRSYFCNLEKIARIEGDTIYMTDEMTFKLQRGRITEFKLQLKAYWMKREGL